jgi:hypothetical protein
MMSEVSGPVSFTLCETKGEFPPAGLLVAVGELDPPQPASTMALEIRTEKLDKLNENLTDVRFS